MQLKKTTYRFLYKWIFILVMAMLAVSGFAQMPIFKRYYMSDVPGLGWTADYIFNHYLHYAGAAILLFMAGYAVADYFLIKRSSFRLSTAGILKTILTGLLIITGLLKVYFNLEGIGDDQTFILALDLIHIFSTVLFLILSLAFLILKTGWLKSIKTNK